MARWVDKSESELAELSRRNKKSWIHGETVYASKPKRPGYARVAEQAEGDGNSPPIIPKKRTTPSIRGRGSVPRDKLVSVPKMRESEVLAGCIRVLDTHPKVAIHWRQNTGGTKAEYKGETRYIRFSFKGASDLMAIIKGTGLFLACECKATGEKATIEQDNFINNVLDAGGYAICVDHPQKLYDYLQILM